MTTTQVAGNRAADARFSDALEALSHPTRVEILRQLRTPRTLREINLVAPVESGRYAGEPRPLARQTVKAHLDRLVEVGVVDVRQANRPYGRTTEYVVNNQSLFVLSEEFRGLARLHPTAPPAGATRQESSAAKSAKAEGPRLTLVKGLDEGRTFDLSVTKGRSSRWIIGRRRNVDVSLDFDPFVSSENSRIVFENGSYFVEDMPTNRNGTSLNFAQLEPGARRPLRVGDVIGVGRCLLLFHA